MLFLKCSVWFIRNGPAFHQLILRVPSKNTWAGNWGINPSHEFFEVIKQLTCPKIKRQISHQISPKIKRQIVQRVRIPPASHFFSERVRIPRRVSFFSERVRVQSRKSMELASKKNETRVGFELAGWFAFLSLEIPEWWIWLFIFGQVKYPMLFKSLLP